MQRNFRSFVAILVCLLLIALAGPEACAQEELLPVPPTTLLARHNISMLAMQSLIALWIFVLGSCFGSFLNVVIYRLPAGMSLGKPKSRCPRCETPLAARDNIPVLGWLILKGKCRYCSLPIAPRYPIIEITCGLLFLVLLFGELLTGAANLPLRHPDHFHVHSGFWLVWFAKWDLSGIYMFHCCLLIIVLAIVMIGFDGHRTQRRLITFGLLVAMVGGTMWPELRPVAGYPWPDYFDLVRFGFTWNDPLSDMGDQNWTGITLTGFLDGLMGVAIGTILGQAVSWSIGCPTTNASDETVPAAIGSSLAVAGAFLGWQACGMLTLFLLPVLAIAKLISNRFKEPAAMRIWGPGTFVLMTAFVLFWRRLDSAKWMIGYRGWRFNRFTWWQDWLATLAGILVVAAAVKYLLPCRRDTVNTEDVEESQ